MWRAHKHRGRVAFVFALARTLLTGASAGVLPIRRRNIAGAVSENLHILSRVSGAAARHSRSLSRLGRLTGRSGARSEPSDRPGTGLCVCGARLKISRGQASHLKSPNQPPMSACSACCRDLARNRLRPDPGRNPRHPSRRCTFSEAVGNDWQRIYR